MAMEDEKRMAESTLAHTHREMNSARKEHAVALHSMHQQEKEWNAERASLQQVSVIAAGP